MSVNIRGLSGVPPLLSPKENAFFVSSTVLEFHCTFVAVGHAYVGLMLDTILFYLLYESAWGKSPSFCIIFLLMKYLKK